MIEWRERLADGLAVAVVLLAGASLAVGIRIALFDATPLRAGSFSSADVADLVTPAQPGPPAPEPPAPSTTLAAEPVPDTTTTSTAPPATTTTAGGGATVGTSTTAASTTSTTSTTLEEDSSNRGRGSDNRGRDKRDEPDD